MKKATARLLLFTSVLLLGLFTANSQDSIALGTQNIIMTDMHVYAELESDCVSTILIDTNVTNVGATDLSSFEMRIDVRGLQVMSASLNGEKVNTSINAVNNYVLLTILSSVSIPSGASMALSLNFSTQCLQEQIGLISNGSMYTNNLIYYIRPLNEIHNLTFSAALPPYSVLYLDAASPLFPIATSNHTDGLRTIYVWKTEHLLPGQEIAYIVKYLMPAVLVNTATTAADNSLMIGIIAAVGGAGAVLVLERAPNWIRRLTTKQVVVSGKLSSQEQEILDLLTSRGGSCPQREIYENLDMSQAMASMMLTSLEERGLIKRLRSGRENIVHIMED
jgi:uncharacterized membrane protein